MMASLALSNGCASALGRSVERTTCEERSSRAGDASESAREKQNHARVCPVIRVRCSSRGFWMQILRKKRRNVGCMPRLFTQKALRRARNAADTNYRTHPSLRPLRGSFTAVMGCLLFLLHLRCLVFCFTCGEGDCSRRPLWSSAQLAGDGAASGLDLGLRRGRERICVQGELLLQLTIAEHFDAVQLLLHDAAIEQDFRSRPHRLR